jgi:hypothetical protein
VFGKTFKIALADGKVTTNPARLVEQRAENNARIRFLSADEEMRLRAAIKKKFAKHMPEFDVALTLGCERVSSSVWNGPKSRYLGNVSDWRRRRMEVIERFR